MTVDSIDLSQFNIQPVYKYVGCVAIIAVVLLVLAVLYRRQLQENFKIPALNKSLHETQKVPTTPPPVTSESIATTFARNHYSFVSYLHALDKSSERIDEKYRELDFWLSHRSSANGQSDEKDIQSDEKDIQTNASQIDDADAIQSQELDINKTM